MGFEHPQFLQAPAASSGRSTELAKEMIKSRVVGQVKPLSAVLELQRQYVHTAAVLIQLPANGLAKAAAGGPASMWENRNKLQAVTWSTPTDGLMATFWRPLWVTAF